MIDIDRLICTLIDDKRLDLGLRASLRDALKQQGIAYNLDGSMIKIGEPKKCEGQLGKMLKEMAQYNSTEDKTHKFNVGDWITDNNDTDRIEKITDRGYHFASGDWGKKDDIEKYYHQWTIQDAKPGDVLTCYSDIKGQPIEQTGIIKQYVGRHGGCSNSFKAHFGVDWDNNVVIEGYMGSSNIYPSNKEQRDILFQKMHKAGYEWDGEALELKKISQRMESAKAKEEVYSSADLTEFEAKLKELFGITDFAARDIGKTLMGIAREKVIEKACEWLKDFCNEHYIMSYSDSHEVGTDELIETFKKKMEE